MSDQARLVESIFLSTLEKDTPVLRAAYLDQACNGDAALRGRVEALLIAHGDAGSFLEKPVFTTDPWQPTTAAEPSSRQETKLDFLTAVSSPDLLGMLGPYEIAEIVGRGGMGVVLKGFDRKLNRIVAIKVLAPELASNVSASKRFLREGQAVAAISHDHVVTIHAIDDAGPLPFIVMEYIAGQSLQERINKTGPLQLKEILRIGRQIALGLAAAHAQGLVHRDIKPANILLENGVERVKITDFGLARAVDDVRITQPGVVTGTPEYMSPEQARGEPVDHRSDLFSLGSVLYTMCTGRAPFRAENTPAMIHRVMEDQPRAIQQINADLPDWLVNLVGRLLAKDPNERFQTAADVAGLLEKCLAHVQQPRLNAVPSELAFPPRWVAGAESSKPRSRRQPWLAAAAVLLIAVIGLGLTEASGVTRISSTIIEIVRGEGKGTIVVEVDDPNVKVLVDGEDVVVEGAGPQEIRVRPGKHEVVGSKDGKAVHKELVTISRDGKEVVRIREESTKRRPGAITREVWPNALDAEGGISPDGRYLSFVDWDTGDLAIRDLATGTNRRLTSKGSWKASPDFAQTSMFSPDSGLVVFGWYNGQKQFSELRLIKADGSSPKILYADEQVTYLEPHSWSPDGKHVLFSVQRKDESTQTLLVSMQDGKPHVLDIFKRRWPETAAFSPDGRFIACTLRASKDAPSADISVIAADGSVEIPLISHPADDKVLSWAPDGSRVLFASNRTGSWDAWAIRVRDGKSYGDSELVKKDIGHVFPMGLTRDGSFYYWTQTGLIDIFVAELDPHTGKVLSAPKHASDSFVGANRFPAWSRDGRFLAFQRFRNPTDAAGRSLCILAMETGEMRELSMRGKLKSVLRDMCWSPDNRSILVPSMGPMSRWTIFKIDVHTGNVEPLLDATEGGGITHSQWAKDGKSLFLVKKQNRNSLIVQWDLQMKRETELYRFEGRILNMLLSPDGNQLTFLTGPGQQESDGPVIKVLPTTGGDPHDLIRLQSPSSFAWAADGKFVFFIKRIGTGGQGTGELWRIPVKGGQAEKLDLSMMGLTAISIHPDGKRIALQAGAPRFDIWAMENFLPPLEATAETPKPAEPKTADKPKQPSGLNVRQIWPNASDLNGAPSPDGRLMSYTDWETGDLAVWDLASGKGRRVTNNPGGWKSSKEYAQASVFSPDGKRLAYNWFNGTTHELRTINIDGSDLKTLYNSKESHFLGPLDWSADGATILGTLTEEKESLSKVIVFNRPAKIVGVNVGDGKMHVYKELAGHRPRRMSLSPDHRYVAYDYYPHNQPTGKLDIYSVATNGSGETAIVDHAATDLLLGWSPDGRNVVFTSDRRGTMDLWAMAVANGRPVGSPQFIKPDVGNVYSLRFTANGAFHYATTVRKTNVNLVSLDIENGKVLTAPGLATPEIVDSTAYADWSPDGKQLAYVLERDKSQVLSIRTLADGRQREIPLDSDRIAALQWSADGRKIVLSEIGNGEPQNRRNIILNVETGKKLRVDSIPMTLENIPGPAILSPDEKAWYFLKGAKTVVRRELATAQDKELYSVDGANKIGALALSPDGKQIVLLIGGDAWNTLKLLPASGGNAREIIQLTGSEFIPAGLQSGLAWSKDGRHVLFTKREGNYGKNHDTLWSISTHDGKIHKFDLPPMDFLRHIRVHPDSQRVLFTAGRTKVDVWAIENFLPPTEATAETTPKSEPRPPTNPAGGIDMS